MGWADDDSSGAGDGDVDLGVCAGATCAVGETCDGSGDCSPLSCIGGQNVQEKTLWLKRNTRKFSREGFEKVTSTGFGVSCSGSQDINCQCQSHDPLPASTLCPPPSPGPLAAANCSHSAGEMCATVALECARQDNTWTFETCDFSTIAVGEAAADLVPGGGSAATDCVAEWAVDAWLQNPAFDHKGLPKTEHVCRDGDPGCDADGAADGRCMFRVGVCLNNPDTRLPACTPQDVATWELKKPRPSSPKPIEAANALALRGAVQALAASTVGGPNGEVVTFTPPFATTEGCSELVELTVPLKGALQNKPGKQKIRTRATTTPPVGAPRGIRDTDTLVLKCVPAA
jgi:hypothetical protein